MEALHWGVPLLGIPLYGQNLANLEKAKTKTNPEFIKKYLQMERRGLGILVEKNEAANGKKLLAAIRTVLNEPRQGGGRRGRRWKE
jgi:UDP:flavonoid glycosyltransferase YjiC (YdhE family)